MAAEPDRTGRCSPRRHVPTALHLPAPPPIFSSPSATHLAVCEAAVADVAAPRLCHLPAHHQLNGSGPLEAAAAAAASRREGKGRRAAGPAAAACRATKGLCRCPHAAAAARWSADLLPSSGASSGGGRLFASRCRLLLLGRASQLGQRCGRRLDGLVNLGIWCIGNMGNGDGEQM